MPSLVGSEMCIRGRTWPDSEIAKFRKAWVEVNAEKSAEDPLWAEIEASYQSYRDKYAVWGSRAYLK